MAGENLSSEQGGAASVKTEWDNMGEVPFGGINWEAEDDALSGRDGQDLEPGSDIAADVSSRDLIDDNEALGQFDGELDNFLGEGLDGLQPEAIGGENSNETDNATIEEIDDVEAMDEKKTIEQRIAELEESMQQIDDEIAAAERGRDLAEDKIRHCDNFLEKNSSWHDVLVSRVEDSVAGQRRTKRNVLTGLKNTLKVAANLALGNHQEAKRLLEQVTRDVEENRLYAEQHKDNLAKLQVNMSRGERTRDLRERAVDAKDSNTRKVNRLGRQKDQMEKRLSLLKEEQMHEQEKANWNNAREAIKNEMGTNNMVQFRRDLEKQRQQRLKELNDDKKALNDALPTGIVAKVLYTPESLQELKDKISAATSEREREYKSQIAEIDHKRDKVDEYFPTWQNRIKQMRENHVVKKALDSLRRKAMLGFYGAVGVAAGAM